LNKFNNVQHYSNDDDQAREQRFYHHRVFFLRNIFFSDGLAAISPQEQLTRPTFQNFMVADIGEVVALVVSVLCHIVKDGVAVLV